MRLCNCTVPCQTFIQVFMYINVDSLIPNFFIDKLHFTTIIYFEALLVPRLASGGPFKRVSGSPAHVPFFLKLFFLFFSPFLSPLFLPLSRLLSFLSYLALFISYLYFPCLSPGISHYSKEHCFLLWQEQYLKL